MNITILKKCLDALKEKEPNISYIQGMLETLVAMSEPTQIVKDVGVVPIVPLPPIPDPYVESIKRSARESGAEL